MEFSIPVSLLIFFHIRYFSKSRHFRESVCLLVLSSRVTCSLTPPVLRGHLTELTFVLGGGGT